MSSQNGKNKTLLDLALEGKSERFKRQVLELVVKTGTDPEDPLFLMLVSTGRLEVMLQETPAELNALFQQWTGQIQQNLIDYQKTAVAQQKKAIAESTLSLIRQAETAQRSRFLGSVVPAMGFLLGAVGLGVIIGLAVPPWLQGGLDPTGKRQLTLEQAETLRWALSSEGKFARKLMQWNSGQLTNKYCTKEVGRLGVTLTVEGRPATYGFCTIWIEPPENRKFQDN
jgi:hypothetical protein